MNQAAKDYLDEALAELGQPVFKKVPDHCDTVTAIAITTLRQALINLCKAMMADAEGEKADDK